ncbi:hypothetical protein [Algoriphagus persicinus]|uniref:hypothetical protein n=1 Tax=Algoriphagus persicinus TaxID=3108754 RepID=UPI002B3E92BD|nr:hypothetical protein [Algoriphagus sp. E1-3-M2]MEB2786831.1 hypothetical protein [Algoriphagus sp. E1-3-M2]
MKREETDKLNREKRIDPDANPLTSFGRDDDFTEELIKGICQKTEVESPTSTKSIIHSRHSEIAHSKQEKVTSRNQRSSRKKRNGIR